MLSMLCVNYLFSRLTVFSLYSYGLLVTLSDVCISGLVKTPGLELNLCNHCMTRLSFFSLMRKEGFEQKEKEVGNGTLEAGRKVKV